MALMNDVYSYIESNYQPNEPIFLSELSIPGMKAVSVRQQMKKLTESGQLKRFDTGIYYIPKKSMFRSGSTLSVDEVIRRKYLADGGNCCGYVGGILFANQLGLTTQVPGAYEIYTNEGYNGLSRNSTCKSACDFTKAILCDRREKCGNAPVPGLTKGDCRYFRSRRRRTDKPSDRLHEKEKHRI